MSLYGNKLFCHECAPFKFSLCLYINHEIYPIIDTNERWQQEYEMEKFILFMETIALLPTHLVNGLSHKEGCSPALKTREGREIR